jgi:ATP-dependent Clp protease ATP-binding subunit ClpA
MFERYTEKARRTIFFARYEASQFGSPFIETEHLLLGVLRENRDLALRFLGGAAADNAPRVAIPPEVAEAEERIQSIVRRMEIAIAGQDFKEARSCSEEERREREILRQLRLTYNLQGTGDLSEGEIVAGIRRQIEANTTPREKVSTSVDLPLSNESKHVLSYAAEETERLNHRHIGTEHLLLGLLREEKCFAADILHERGLRLSQVREEIARSSPAEAGRTGFGFGRAGGTSRSGPRPEHLAGMSGWLSALQDAGRVLQLARNEAAQRHSPCIETTDLLLALLLEKEVTERFLCPAESVRKHKNLEPAPRRARVSAEELAFSEDCKLAFYFAIEEAAQLWQRTGPGHLLLGILRTESCAAAEILRDCGLTEAGIRAQLRPPPPSSDPEQGRSYV